MGGLDQLAKLKRVPTTALRWLAEAFALRARLQEKLIRANASFLFAGLIVWSQQGAVAPGTAVVLTGAAQEAVVFVTRVGEARFVTSLPVPITVPGITTGSAIWCHQDATRHVYGSSACVFSGARVLTVH